MTEQLISTQVLPPESSDTAGRVEGETTGAPKETAAGVSAGELRRLVAESAALALAWFGAMLSFVALLLHFDDPGAPAWTAIRHVLMSWDAQWYLGIAQSGYHWDASSTAMQNPSFYPLYPLLERLGHLIGIPWSGAAVGLSVGFQAAAAAVLARLCIQEGTSVGQARTIVTLYVLFPAGVFACLGYATSLGAFLALATLLAYRQGRRVLAFFLAGLGTAADPTNLAVSAGLVLYEAWTAGWPRAFEPRRIALYLTGFFGVGAFAAYLGVAVNSPLAFYQAVRAWAPSIPFWELVGRVVTLEPIRASILGYVEHQTEYWFMYFQDGLVLLALVVVLLLILHRERRVGPSVAVVTLALLLALGQGARIGEIWSGTRIVYPVLFFLAPVPVIRKIATGGISSLLIVFAAVGSCAWMFLLVHGLWVE